VISLEFERPGHLLATCGADKTVQTWDLNTNGHVTTFHVSLGGGDLGSAGRWLR
jgi:WD40 repeat protein